MTEKLKELLSFLEDTENPASVIALRFVNVAATILLTFILIKLLHWIVNRLLKRKTKTNKRINTLRKLINSVITYTVTILALVQVLQSAFNINLASIFAAAGIVGVAVGFGAQTLVKDIIAGFFILLEGQFSVGDRITIMGPVGTSTFTGTVDELGLRSTRVRDSNGDIFIIPNGSITSLTNHSLLPNSFYVSCVFPPETDSNAMLLLFEKIAKRAEKDLSPLTKTPVPSIAPAQEEGCLSIWLKVTCQPESKALMEKEMPYRVRKALAADGVELPDESIALVSE